MNALKSNNPLKILLVSPSRKYHGVIEYFFADRSQPLGLYYLKAFLQKNSIECKIIDLNICKISSLYALLPKYDAIGITTYATTIEAVTRLVNEIRKRKKNILVICGGPDASYRPEYYIDKKIANIVVCGEGEETLLEVCQRRQLPEINGIVYKTKSALYKTSARKRITELDSIPFPSRENHFQYITNFNESTTPLAFPILTSRGCSGSCIFCSKSVFGRYITHRSIDNVIFEIEELIKKYKISSFRITDDLFTNNKINTIEFCTKLIEKSLKIKWSCSTRIDMVDKELLILMKKAGCYRIIYGVEHLNNIVLNKMGKGYTPAMALKTLQITKNTGIEITANFILNFPGSTTKQDINLLKLIPKLPIDFLLLSFYVNYKASPEKNGNNYLRYTYLKRNLGKITTITYFKLYLRPRMLIRFLFFYTKVLTILLKRIISSQRNKI